jgi:energy-coupling factor transporter ATP-binding protein EcfA2
MVRTLRVRNFGVMEEVEVELGAGLTVLTGETGAGKSMLIDALVLLSGGRSDGSMIRAGCEEALVEAVFDVDAALRERLEAPFLVGPPAASRRRRWSLRRAPSLGLQRRCFDAVPRRAEARVELCGRERRVRVVLVLQARLASSRRRSPTSSHARRLGR